MNAKEVKEIRTNLNLSQEEFAKLIGVSKNTVYNYENGSKIPDSKITILQDLKLKKHNIINETTNNYETSYDKKIADAEKRIKELEIKLKSNDPDITEGTVNLIKTIIEELYKEISIHQIAKNDKLEYLKELEKENNKENN